VLPDAGVVEIGRLLEVVLANRQAERSYTPVVYPNQITFFRAEELIEPGIQTPQWVGIS
jgi:hypothetical protein